MPKTWAEIAEEEEEELTKKTSASKISAKPVTIKAIPASFNDAYPEFAFDRTGRSQILANLDMEQRELPAWSSGINLGDETYTGPIENAPLSEQTPLEFAYKNIASKNRPVDSNKYFIFRMLTGTGKTTVVPIAWLLAGPEELRNRETTTDYHVRIIPRPLLITQPRRENVLSAARALSIYAGEWIFYDKGYVDARVKNIFENEIIGTKTNADRMEYAGNICGKTDETEDRRNLFYILVTIDKFAASEITDKFKTPEGKLGCIPDKPPPTMKFITRRSIAKIATSLSNILPYNQFYKKIAKKYSGLTQAVSVDYKMGKSDGDDPYKHKAARYPKILVVTEGWLVERLATDPNYLDWYHTILFDEAHERTEQFDVLFSIAAASVKPHFIILASATIDDTVYMNYYPTRIFQKKETKKIEERSVGFATVKNYLKMTISATHNALEDYPSSSIIVFLPTRLDVDKMKEEFVNERIAGLSIFDFTSASSPETKDLARTSPVRKLIIATNAGETGVTFAGVDICIDSGMMNHVSYDPVYDASSFKIGLVYEENSKQRRGRVGRERDGVYIPLYDTSTLKKSPPPKIIDKPAHETVYRMMRIANSLDVRDFNRNLLTPLSDIAIYHAYSNLYHMCIIDNAEDAQNPINVGPFYSAGMTGDVRYLVAAGLSRRTAPLFVILYAYSVFGIVDLKTMGVFATRPYGSDHLQLIFKFCYELFNKVRQGGKWSERMLSIIGEITEILNINPGDEKYNRDSDILLDKYQMNKSEIEPRRLAALRYDIETAMIDQHKENFETFRRCMYISHVDKIAERTDSNNTNEYVWRGLPVKIVPKHKTSSAITLPPWGKIQWERFNFDKDPRAEYYYVASPPRIAFSSITKNNDDTYATIDMFTWV